MTLLKPRSHCGRRRMEQLNIVSRSVLTKDIQLDSYSMVSKVGKITKWKRRIDYLYNCGMERTTKENKLNGTIMRLLIRAPYLMNYQSVSTSNSSKLT